MDSSLKHKLGTTIAINKREVLSYFNKYINCHIDNSKHESYLFKDSSILILQQSGIDEKVFVKFHLNFTIDSKRKRLNFQGKNWFMEFCKLHNSEIENLRTGIIMPVSDGAILSDIFTSRAFKIAKHFSIHPKDFQFKNRKIMTQKQIATNFLQLAAKGKATEAFNNYVAPNFKHHNVYFKGDGETLMNAMNEAHQSNPNKIFEIQRALEDGDLVAVHSHVRQKPEDLGYAVMHIFKFENNKIVELWDFGQAVLENMVNENGMF